MAQFLFRLIVLCGLTLSLLSLNPIGSYAESENDWELDTTESVSVTFERMQSFKDRILGERRLGLESFQSSTLSENELFLDTYVGQQKSLVLAITRDDSKLLELPGHKELEPVLTRLHQLASNVNSNPDSLRVATDEVASLLFGQLADQLAGCNHLIFSADGIFNLVPTSVLLSHKKKMEFSRVPSVAILVDLRLARSSRAPIDRVRALAVGAPYEAGKEHLQGANQELDNLSQTYKNITLIKPNGSGALPELELLGSFDLVHVAAPYVGDDRNVRQSAILLHPTNHEMMIRASDLTGLQLDSRMIVLARRSSAAEGHLSGVGVQSLVSAFLDTGTPTVVAALWPVDNDATCYFMAAFYEGLSSGFTAGGAMKFARAKCQNDPVFNKPIHWGAFVLVGDNQTSLPLELKPNINVGRILAAILGVFAALIFLLLWSRKKGSP